jgi:hypothetical protein
MIAAERHAGWFDEEAPVGCAKRMWDGKTMVHSTSLSMKNRARFSCDGFFPWSRGRNVEARFKLADERRIYRRQLRLSLLPFLGGLNGALIAAFFAKRRCEHCALGETRQSPRAHCA